MELNHYCWKIYRDTLFHAYYAILDDSFSLANLRLMEYRIKVKFIDAYARPGARYVMHICRLRKRDEKEFLKVMEELPELMKECGNSDYREYCMSLQPDLERANLKRFQVM